jgi:hypothetical protein
LNPNGRVGASHRQIAMKTTSTSPEIFESTYALLLRSEEKQRSRFETLIYTVLAVSTIFAVLQFGREAAMMPSSIAHVSTTVSAPAQHGA